jgi:multiple sugar transport system permease protein/putative aldouronate transport system permease protein
MKQLRLNQKSTGDRLFYFVINTILLLFFLVTLYPLVFLLSASISSPTALAQGRVVILPVGFTLEGYAMVFRNRNVLSGFYNSVIYTTVGTLINLFVTLITAFALSRRELKGNAFISFMFAFTMWFSGGIIPLFLLVNNLGMLNTRWALWLPVSMSVWNVMITRTYFKSTIPEEMFEAVSIDGCGYFRFFSLIVLPLSGAIIAVMSLFYSVMHWNTFFRALIFLSNHRLYPIQMVLRAILIANEITAEDLMADAITEANFGKVELLKYALILVACLPLWILYPFIQKFFVKGVMIGSIKG